MFFHCYLKALRNGIAPLLGRGRDRPDPLRTFNYRFIGPRGLAQSFGAPPPPGGPRRLAAGRENPAAAPPARGIGI